MRRATGPASTIVAVRLYPVAPQGGTDYLPPASGQGLEAPGRASYGLSLFRRSSNRRQRLKIPAMDSFELNKIIGAILGTLLFVMGVGFLAEAIYHPIQDRGPGLTLAEAEVGGEHGGEAEEAAPVVPLGTLLASADVAAGQASVKKCASCHNFGEGESNKTGPLLYGVVDRPIGSHEGFAYSAGMEEHLTKGDLWSYPNLDAFIAAPKTFTPGTKMSFSGVKDPVERANILAYLQTLSPSPVPFPPPEAAPAEGAAAPADDAAAPAEGAAPAAAPAEEAAPVATEAVPVETPTTTDSETPVEGTPAPATTEPAAPAAQ